MISKWLGIGLDDFRLTHFQRAPLATPSNARDATEILTWSTIASLLDTDVDRLVVRNSTLVDARPANIGEALRLFHEGYSLVLRHCERYDEKLHELAEAFAAETEGDVVVQIYATPGGFHSFGWHYDCEDVYIAQTRGVKEYFLRENTVNPRPSIDAMPRDMQYERETTPTIASTLMAGDALYIPRGWWHVARCIESSLSISVGVLSPAAR